MNQEINVRHDVAQYLARAINLAELHARVAEVFARSHDDVAVNYLFGLLTDLHAGLLSEHELHDELQALVSEVRVLPAWSLMADWVNNSRSASTSVVIPPPAVPLPQSSPMFFERSPAAEPA